MFVVATPGFIESHGKKLTIGQLKLAPVMPVSSYLDGLFLCASLLTNEICSRI